jgi:hypothetical protein
VASGAGGGDTPQFSAGAQSDAELAAGAEIERFAARAREDLGNWIEGACAQLDRLQDHVMGPYRSLPAQELRTRYTALRNAIAERKRVLRESSDVSVQPPRLVGRVYVRAGALTPATGASASVATGGDLNGLEDRERVAVDTEMIAMRRCWEHLEAEGFHVDDVHQSGCGYDLHARREYEQRLVEVKGMQGDISPGITLESSEWLMAQQHREEYWVYVVVDCATEPRLFAAYRNPVALFGDEKRLVQRFHVGAATLRRASNT